jgi:UDP-N-acetyl-D-mannosaminuronic acid transferase (WecB/TagA/CpsF family)
MNKMFMMSLDMYLEAIELAQKKGKVAGDSIAEELLEVMKKHKEEVTYLGETEMDSQLLKGNLEEEGLRIIDLTKKEDEKK